MTVPLIPRVIRVGVAAAVIVALAGRAVEYVRFGGSDEAALARVESQLRERFDASADALAAIAARIVATRETIANAARDQGQARRLFDIAAAAAATDDSGRTGITIYDALAAPIAWAGRVSDPPRERVQGPRALFVVPGALGPRLIHVEPVIDGAAPAAARRATIVVEQSLGDVETAPGSGDTFVMRTSLAPVTVRASVAGVPAPPRAFGFAVSAPGGGALVDAEVTPSDLAAARARWRQLVTTSVLLLAALTLLLCTAPFIDRRREARGVRPFVVATGVLVGLLVAARFVFYFALRPLAPPGEPTPVDLLLTTLSLTALVWLGVDLVERRRTARPHARIVDAAPRSTLIVTLAYAAAGAAGVWLLWNYERLLRNIVAESTIDVVHFSLHPLSATRLALSFSLVLLHATALWTAAGIARIPAIWWRVPRAIAPRTPVLGWVAGAAAAIVVTAAGTRVPIGPLVVAVTAAGAAAAALVLLRQRARRASQAARMFGLLLALMLPALAMYPSLFAFATAAKEALVANTYGPQALSQREDLKEQLQQSVDEIDALPSLADFVVGSEADTPTTDRAFLVWSRTELAVHRLTSAVELYSADGRLVSRFALNLPEYSIAPYYPASCNWDSLEEVSPFGSMERHVLRAGRGICDGRRRPVGGIVVRAMLDPRTLPFISSQSPYLESLREARRPQAEGVSGRDVEFVVYGWSRGPIYASGTSVWKLPDAVFQRTVESREAFWTTIDRDDQTFRVYVMNDRGGIYALGYPVPTWLGQLISVAELVMLAFVLYLFLLVGATLFSAVLLRTPQSGRALLREVRSSFYHKLFLFFVAGAVVPVLILAVVTRNYFAAQLDAGAAENAARTVTTAQRLVEDYATLQQRGTSALAAIDDQIMVLVRRAVDEDVNLFDRTRLQATSARDLFASQLLSMRTPADVYKNILLDRLPTFVGDEEVGTSRYRLAAAPVRTGGRENIVTVPLANRQQQFENQIDELDRRVISAAVLFSLLGAALGYWMAERIADPVSRLTRATRRIARGDLDARIPATSSDELRRLVEDFNQMAADLKRQRTELERTQRLEAWADMARQVAHDIKNPLTPIQLSAEHARRINLDRGRPLSPVLDECVSAILGQVKLLRQISAEFSSFASSPTPRPEPSSLPSLIEEVVEPYRTGLAGRIAIDTLASADLPSVRIDRTLFARALTNVIENALHAMPGEGRLTIRSRQSTVDSRQSGVDGRQSGVDSRQPDADTPSAAPDRPSAILVEITDTGVGMDQDALDKIFEPYFSTKTTGTGLGLTIAKRNVELNGGEIDVRSQRGVGTTVTMTLPLA